MRDDIFDSRRTAQASFSPKTSPKSIPEARSHPKIWIITVSITGLMAVLMARLPIFKLNLEKPLKANYIELPEYQPLDGNLKANDRLEATTYLARGRLRGAQTIAFGANRTIYTGLMNGQIVRVNIDGSVKTLTQMGDETNETKCNDHGADLQHHASCGRPLGLRLRGEFLYVTDAYHGLFKVNVHTGVKQLLLSSHDKRFGTAPARFTSDLDLDGNLIYFIDASYERDVNEALEEHLEALARGRLFSYDEKLNKLEFLLENLYFPSGVQLMPDKQALLINENSMSRIIKFYLQGEKKGSKEVFADIPGYGHTIRLTDRNTLLVSFGSVRYSKHASILDLFGRFPFVRTLFSFILNTRHLWLKLPKYGLLVEYDFNGKPIRSWHDVSGKIVESTSSALICENKIYIGSFYADFIGVVDY